ncbi:MAG TPA: peptide ABC transporter substrate-binding protein, partial [Enterococcus sp.]|nr:peptide ABC transporter substrate-binding protein [Enterococcus sp.]
LFVAGNSYNRGQWSNVDYDKVVDDSGNKDAGDEQARWADLQEATKIMSDDMGVIPVY